MTDVSVFVKQNKNIPSAPHCIVFYFILYLFHLFKLYFTREKSYWSQIPCMCTYLAIKADSDSDPNPYCIARPIYFCSRMSYQHGQLSRVRSLLTVRPAAENTRSEVTDVCWRACPSTTFIGSMSVVTMYVTYTLGNALCFCGITLRPNAVVIVGHSYSLRGSSCYNWRLAW